MNFDTERFNLEEECRRYNIPVTEEDDEMYGPCVVIKWEDYEELRQKSLERRVLKAKQEEKFRKHNKHKHCKNDYSSSSLNSSGESSNSLVSIGSSGSSSSENKV
jgi:hypothetical protein